MVFKRIMQALGVGGPTIETVLDPPETAPGGTLTGRLEITGGDHDTEIEEILLFLEAQVEHEYEYDYEDAEGEEQTREGEFEVSRKWAESRVSDAFSLAAEEKKLIEFELPVPFETPITAIGDGEIPGTPIGVRTRLSIDRALDTGDMDPITVRALPVQEKILTAFGDLGFEITTMDLEPGELNGTDQQLRFHQEIEFSAGDDYQDVTGGVELSFVTDDDGAYVVLQIETLDDGGHTFRVAHADADDADTDWTEKVAAELSAAVDG